MNSLALATIDTFRNRISNVDALTLFRSMPDQSVQTIVTSPPYYGLRDYGVDGQLGLEDTPQAYVAALVEIFHEARRVLRDDGTLWLNLGDSYASGEIGRHDFVQGKKIAEQTRAKSFTERQQKYMSTGLPSKNLLMIPARVAIALQDDGWILRSDIIWHKPNPMPESVKDRPTSAHEHLFLLAKSGRYYYDADAIAEPLSREYTGTSADGGLANRQGMKHVVIGNQAMGSNLDLSERATRNRRNVWTIPTQPYSGAHFAVFPPKLIEPCILAGSAPGDIVCDPFMGSGTTAMVSVQHARQYVGAEINPDYIALAEERLSQPIQVSLFSFAGVAA